MDDSTKKGILINSIIGHGTRFTGDIELRGLLRIDGDFEGNIRTEGRVLIGKKGRARCSLEADTVVVGGIVEGSITARSKVVLLSTCVLIGSISAPNLVVEEGVFFHGPCAVSNISNTLQSDKSGQFALNWAGA